MATFNFNCPQCGNLLSGEDEWRGMETQCPYCQNTIIVPTNIVIKKANILKRSIAYLKSHPIALISIIMILAAAGVIWWWLYKEYEEKNLCHWTMYHLAENVSSTNTLTYCSSSLSCCPSGKQWKVNVQKDVEIQKYQLTPRVPIIECPKHKIAIARSSEDSLYLRVFYAEDLNRNAPLFNNSTVRQKAEAFLATYEQKVFNGDRDIRLHIRAMIYWQGLLDVDSETRKEIVHILKVTGHYKSDWKWIPELKNQY